MGNTKSRNAKRCKPSLRFLSALLVFAFAGQDLAYALGGAPAWPAAKTLEKSAREKDGARSLSLPALLGIRRYSSLSGSAETVIQIEDAHDSLQAQEKITGILSLLVSDYDVRSVALEGSSGAIDPAIFKSYPDAAGARRSAEKLCREGRLSAGEFFAVTSSEPVAVYGVEDRKLYRENLRSLRRLLRVKDGLAPDLNGLKRTLEVLGERVWSAEVKMLRANAAAASAGQTEFSRRWDALRIAASAKGLDVSCREGLAVLSEVMALEKEIDFNAANSERGRLLEFLRASLDHSEFDALLLRSIKFKAGRISDGEYHARLGGLARARGADPAAYPNLARYMRYTALFETIDLVSVTREIASLEDDVRRVSFASDDERALEALEKRARVLTAMISGRASEEEHVVFKANPAMFDAASFEIPLTDLCRKYQVPAYGGLRLARLVEAVPNAARFYELAERRNDVLVANTLLKMRVSGRRVAALVTGGFHTQGVTDALKSKNLSCLIVTPRITDLDSKRPYITILTRRPKEHETALSSQTGRYQLALGNRLLDSGRASDVAPGRELPCLLRPLAEELLRLHEPAAAAARWMENYETIYNGRKMRNPDVAPARVRVALARLTGLPLESGTRLAAVTHGVDVILRRHRMAARLSPAAGFWRNFREGVSEIVSRTVPPTKRWVRYVPHAFPIFFYMGFIHAWGGYSLAAGVAGLLVGILPLAIAQGFRVGWGRPPAWEDFRVSFVITASILAFDFSHFALQRVLSNANLETVVLNVAAFTLWAFFGLGALNGKVAEKGRFAGDFLSDRSTRRLLVVLPALAWISNGLVTVFFPDHKHFHDTSFIPAATRLMVAASFLAGWTVLLIAAHSRSFRVSVGLALYLTGGLANAVESWWFNGAVNPFRFLSGHPNLADFFMATGLGFMVFDYWGFWRKQSEWVSLAKQALRERDEEKIRTLLSAQSVDNLRHLEEFLTILRDLRVHLSLLAAVRRELESRNGDKGKKNLESGARLPEGMLTLIAAAAIYFGIFYGARFLRFLRKLYHRKDRPDRFSDLKKELKTMVGDLDAAEEELGRLSDADDLPMTRFKSDLIKARSILAQIEIYMEEYGQAGVAGGLATAWMARVRLWRSLGMVLKDDPSKATKAFLSEFEESRLAWIERFIAKWEGMTDPAWSARLHLQVARLHLDEAKVLLTNLGMHVQRAENFVYQLQSWIIDPLDQLAKRASPGKYSADFFGPQLRAIILEIEILREGISKNPEIMAPIKTTLVSEDGELIRAVDRLNRLLSAGARLPIAVGVTSESARAAVSAIVGHRDDVRVVLLDRRLTPEACLAALESAGAVFTLFYDEEDPNADAKMELIREITRYLREADFELHPLFRLLLDDDARIEGLTASERDDVAEEALRVLPIIAPRALRRDTERSARMLLRQLKLHVFHPSFGQGLEAVDVAAAEVPRAAVWTLDTVASDPFFFDTLNDRDAKIGERMVLHDYVIVPPGADLEMLLGPRYADFETRFPENRRLEAAPSLGEMLAVLHVRAAAGGVAYTPEHVLFVDRETGQTLRQRTSDEREIPLLVVRGPYALALDKVVAEILMRAGSGEPLFIKGLTRTGKFFVFAPIAPADFAKKFAEYYRTISQAAQAA